MLAEMATYKWLCCAPYKTVESIHWMRRGIAPQICRDGKASQDVQNFNSDALRCLSFLFYFILFFNPWVRLDFPLGRFSASTIEGRFSASTWRREARPHIHLFLWGMRSLVSKWYLARRMFSNSVICLPPKEGADAKPIKPMIHLPNTPDIHCRGRWWLGNYFRSNIRKN